MSEVEDWCDDLIVLMQDLLCILMFNLFGENYCDICEYIVNCFQLVGFVIELICVYGMFGDSEKYLCWNVIVC